MKILLIGVQNSGCRSGYSGLFLPFGLAYISAILKKNNHLVDCIDLHTEEIRNNAPLDSWEKIKVFDFLNYDIVAFGGVFLKYKILKYLSEKIWECNKRIFQIAGGHIATNIADIILEDTKINCVCLYEGEESIVELLNSLGDEMRWQTTPGIKYLGLQGQVVQTAARQKINDLDKIPFPDREYWNFNIIRKAFPYGSPGRYSAIIFASRGCPFSCFFCNPTNGKLIRSRSPINIVEEIIYLKKKWNVQYVRFFDEVFIGSKEKIKKLCNLMIEEKINIFWWCQTQIKLIDEELLKVMKKAGCIEISYGIESGSDIILSEMKKGITSEMSKKVIEMTDRIGIRPSLNFIAGTPSETYETLEETKNFVKSLNYINWIQVPSIDFVVPVPGTELFKIAKEKGFIQDERKYLTERLYELNRYTNTINMTNMRDEDFRQYIIEQNNDIELDYYLKHHGRKILSLFGLDHLRLDLVFKHFTLRQARPLAEALIWAAVGKRKNRISSYINRFIYR